MQFTLSAMVALALSLSVATAAPAASTMSKRWDSLNVYFEGADPATDFSVTVPVDQPTPVGPSSRGHPDLSISYVNYDRYNYKCQFTAAHDGQGAAQAALACSGNQCQLGPPQPVYTVTCESCYGSPYCDGYPSL